MAKRLELKEDIIAQLKDVAAEFLSAAQEGSETR